MLEDKYVNAPLLLYLYQLILLIYTRNYIIAKETCLVQRVLAAAA